jgi:TRL (tRNA-associated locus)-like protein
MKYLLTVMIISVALLSLAACMPVASPVIGLIYTDAKYGDTATTATASPKEGKACATTILGWIATGDATVNAAKAVGGITQVSSVDHTAKNILGVWGEWCTIVRGT